MTYTKKPLQHNVIECGPLCHLSNWCHNSSNSLLLGRWCHWLTIDCPLMQSSKLIANKYQRLCVDSYSIGCLLISNVTVLKRCARSSYIGNTQQTKNIHNLLMTVLSLCHKLVKTVTNGQTSLRKRAFLTQEMHSLSYSS